MTLFEYLSVATSIVLSLSAAQLLGQLRSVVRSTTRYWVHVLWIFFALLLHLLIWWEFWGYRTVVSWDFFSFALLLLNPAILFVCSSALVRTESNAFEDWSRHFFEVRKTVFLTLAMLTPVSVLRRLVLTDMPILSSQNFPEAIFALLFLVGLISKSKKLHAGLVLTCWIVLVITTVNIWFQPGEVVNQS